MFFVNWKLNRFELKLVGLKARLNAAREVFDSLDDPIPYSLVQDLCVLPQKIAELETKAKQLRLEKGLNDD